VTRLSTAEVTQALTAGGLEINLAGEGTFRTEPQPIEGGPILARRDRDGATRLYHWAELASWLETLRWREHAQA
jgi:hypothetical protein